MAEIYDENWETLTEGLQGCNICDEAIQLAKVLSKDRGETVLLVDDDGSWDVSPDGSISRNHEHERLEKEAKEEEEENWNDQ